MKKGLYSIRKLQRIMIFLFLIPILAQQTHAEPALLSGAELGDGGKQEKHHLSLSAADGRDVHRISTTIANYWAQEYSHKRLLYAQSPLDAYKYAFNVLDITAR